MYRENGEQAVVPTACSIHLKGYAAFFTAISIMIIQPASVIFLCIPFCLV
jgi:hypothetical protein